VRELSSCLSDTQDPESIRQSARAVVYGPLSETNNAQKPGKIITFRKIFTILAIIERQSTIGKFLKEGVSDADLPLERFEREGGSGIIGLRRRKEPEKTLECFRGWSQSRLWAFEDRQWMTLAPFFARGEVKNVRHYILDSGIILPLTVESHSKSSSKGQYDLEGGFGRVFKAHIHQDHHNFNDPQVYP